MLDTAKSVISITLGVGAGLLVLWVIGKAHDPAAPGLTAVGVGIHQIIDGFTQIVSGL